MTLWNPVVTISSPATIESRTTTTAVQDIYSGCSATGLKCTMILVYSFTITRYVLASRKGEEGRSRYSYDHGSYSYLACFSSSLSNYEFS
jgi:hypothetical protein